MKSHMFSVAFTVESERIAYDLTREELIAAALRRLADVATDEAGIEAFQHEDTAAI